MSPLNLLHRPPGPPAWEHRIWSDSAVTAFLGCRYCLGSKMVAYLDETSRPPVDGHFRAGSVTKSFTATAVLQLVGEGELHLSDGVEQWLPGLVDRGADITIRHLLQNTSGLPEYSGGHPRGALTYLVGTRTGGKSGKASARLPARV
ncbi:serine hydrolase domain-containing protein [Streptosporangium sp. NPDC002544]|uniref:serine hydrolase domain-containing protein n=1 Tax=Streptosporangium sp. NPDC002544 TaxID=3154538 RepID=UPI00332F277A